MAVRLEEPQCAYFIGYISEKRRGSDKQQQRFDPHFSGTYLICLSGCVMFAEYGGEKSKQTNLK